MAAEVKTTMLTSHARFSSSSTPTSTDRGFAETIGLAEEVGVLEGRRAPSQLLRQVSVEALGGAGGGRPAGALPGLGQLQALHLLGHQPRKVSATKVQKNRGGFIPCVGSSW